LTSVEVRWVGLLQDDGHLGCGVERVVGPDLCPEAVLERGDDPPSARVVLGVGRGDEHDVERQPDLVPADLDVTLLQDVEQADLDPLGEVRELVDSEDPTVGARHQAVVERELVGQVPPLGDLHGVDFADQVGDRGVGGGKLLAETLLTANPFDRAAVALGGDQFSAVARHRVVGVVQDLRAGDYR
jgi:hypothetical protein